MGFGDKKSTLSLSKKTFINGLATSNKKLIVHFLKDSVIAKQRDENGTNICNGNLLYTSKLLNASFFLPVLVELDKDENRPVQPKLSAKLDFNFGNQTYELTAIIYHHDNHFWCEKRVLHSGFQKGWYIYNDLQNNGQAA